MATEHFDVVIVGAGLSGIGAGYHLLQSKIGLGSGGLVGKGYMMGTQRELNFLPEMQTDFIFTMFAEEMGLVGALGLLVIGLAVFSVVNRRDPAQPRALPWLLVILLGVAGLVLVALVVFAASRKKETGIPVTIVETTQEALDRGLRRMRENYEKSVARGRLSREAAEQRMRLISPTLVMEDIAAADIVIEAVFENMELKKDIFRRIDALAKPGAVLATNTSYLDVNEIAAVTQRPGDVLGMHFFSPANVMKLLEIVRTGQVSSRTLKTALAVGAAFGKICVVAGVCDGFIGNRMYRAYQRQAFHMLEDGALPHEIDAAIVAFGFAMGPLCVADLTGHDNDFDNRRREDALRDPKDRYVELPDKVVERGRLGQKTGAGWYRYGNDGRTPIRDPEIESLIIEESRRKGIARRPISSDEIRLRALAALVNEGANILTEGIAIRAGDIDVAWVNGYGFPAWRGGPMCYADRQGLFNVVRAMKSFARNPNDDSAFWTPAPLLERLAREGGTFTSAAGPEEMP